MSYLKQLFHQYLYKYRLFRFFRHITVYVFSQYQRICLNRKVKCTSFIVSSPLLSLHDFKDYSQSVTRDIFSEYRVTPSIPCIYPKGNESLIELGELSFSKVQWLELHEATILAKTEFFIIQGRTIHHNLIELHTDYFSEELHLKTTVLPEKKSILWHQSCYPNENETIPEGIHLLSATSANYAHWTTEILPKIAIIASSSYYQDVPLLIDESLHDNIKQSIRVLVGLNRKVIEISNDFPITVKKLIVIDAVGYVAFQPRSKSSTCNLSFSMPAFQHLRTQMEMALPIQKKNLKIFIKRSSTIRNLSNQDEIEKALLQQGFITVCPEKISFIEQYMLFRSASMVVGATGAAFANLIFCSQDCRVVILIAKHPEMVYPYWILMGEAAGVQVDYVLGRGDLSTVHADFKIKIEHLLDALSRK